MAKLTKKNVSKEILAAWNALEAVPIDDLPDVISIAKWLIKRHVRGAFKIGQKVRLTDTRSGKKTTGHVTKIRGERIYVMEGPREGSAEFKALEEKAEKHGNLYLPPEYSCPIGTVEAI